MPMRYVVASDLNGPAPSSKTRSPFPSAAASSASPMPSTTLTFFRTELCATLGNAYISHSFSAVTEPDESFARKRYFCA